MLKCATCGKSFSVIPFRANKAKYCSNECYNISQRKEIQVKCVICKKTISVAPYRLKSDKILCSWKCKIDAQKTRPLKACPVCGREFKAHMRKRRNGLPQRQVYCSRKCMAIAYQKALPTICLICGRNFTSSPSKRKRFCSINCKNIYLSKKMKDEYKEGIRENPKVANQFSTGKRIDLENQFFRSSWEANIARFLNYLNVKWVYEPERFLLPDGSTYLPDFYIEEDNTYLEIKGYYKDLIWQNKMEMFKKTHNTLLIDKKLYFLIKKAFSNNISFWEEDYIYVKN